MENDLHQAFYGVFCSSKEIIKNKQKHLYVNMLDLLLRTCKTTGLAEGTIGTEKLVEFWLEDILPLIFFNDKNIQSRAITTLEQALDLMGISAIHSSQSWPEIRNNIVTALPDEIHELRTNKNSHWHEVWCVIIRILDREILNGASTINAFLSTVELGFRSSDSSVRAETFLCWRLLIKIFDTYNELLTPKRLKLICIPLKSTQSKSANLANVKTRVWWYFITCIGDKLGENFTKVVEPFLTYVFGLSNREVVADVQQYENVRIIGLVSLAQLLIDETDDLIDVLIVENDLEMLKRPSPLLDLSILKENWKILTSAILSALRLLSYDDDDEGEGESGNQDVKQHLRNWFVLRLINIMLQLNYAPCTQEICRRLIEFLPTKTLPLSTALNCIAKNNITSEVSQLDVENFSNILESILSLLIAGKNFILAGILQRCIERIGKTPQLFERQETREQALCAIIKVICNSKDDDDFEAYQTRLLCWNRVAQTTIAHLTDKNLSYRQKDFADNINNFILWPLQQFASFTGRCQSICLNDDFCASWRQLLLCGQNAPEREQFLQNVEKSLRDLMKCEQKDLPLPELVNSYVTAMLKADSGKNSTNIQIILSFLRDLIDQPKLTATKSFEIHLNTIRNVFLHMKNQEIIQHFELVKMSISHVVNIVAKEKPSNIKFFNDWKQGILDRFRTIQQKNYSAQVREIFKNDDVFVIIPNVWMLNPDKLTERQKERFAERSDIPALYNDMSQSQDSSIKPWTPNKIVIAKKDQTEIVIGPSQQIDEANNEDNENSKITNAIEIRTTRKRATKTADIPNDNVFGTKTKNTNFKPSDSEIEENKFNNKNNTEVISAESNTAIRTRKSLRNNKLEAAEHKEIDTAVRGIEVKSPKKSKQPENSPNQKKLPDISECAQEKPLTPAPIGQRRLSSLDTQTNTETQTQPTEKIIPSDEVIPETPIETVVISEQTVQLTEPNTRTETLEMNPEPKEVSPKKPTTKIFGLSSPPDRKSTNNSCSPSLRPKPTPHLTRGAQFISMIRSKMKVDTPTPGTSMTRFSICPNKIDKRESTPIPEGILESMGMENTSTPLQKKELLTFTKRLPSPSASPSASILKRKLRRDSIEDISIESPATKRKRVSFHDPPVSLTKEYLRDVEDNQTKNKRTNCPTMDKMNTGQKTSHIKNALKRRNKIDSMVEIESFPDETCAKPNEASTSSARKIALSFEDDNNTETPAITCQPLSLPEGEASVPALPDVDTALDVVLRECSIDTVLERYLSSDTTSTVKAADTLAKFVSKCMNTDPRIKTSVLEILSENHSKDFLDHAVQENLSSVVCDRLNLGSVIDYICAKSKLNTNCRNSLLMKIPEILQHSKVEKEPYNFIGKLVESLKPTDATILDLITNLMCYRNDRQSSSTPDMDSTDVSSSNL